MQLQRHIDKLDKQSGDIFALIDVWRDKHDSLFSVPGVRPAVDNMLLPDLPELGQVSKKEISALTGVAPFLS